MKGLEFTTIRYRVRKSLDLSIAEYCLCDMVYHLAYNAENTLRYCYASKSTLAEELGITERGIFKMIERLEEMGLIERHDDRRMLRTTVKWQNAHFCSEYEQSSVSDGMNKVQVDYEQSSVETMNKVHTNNKEKNKGNNKDAGGAAVLDSSQTPKEKPRFTEKEKEMLRFIFEHSGMTTDEGKKALAGFFEMRKAIRDPIKTQRQAEILGNKLRKTFPTEKEAIEALEESTLKNYKSVYKPNEPKPQAGGQAGFQFIKAHENHF